MNENMSGQLERNLVAARLNVQSGKFSSALQNYVNYFLSVPEEQRCSNTENEFVNLLCDVVIFFNDASSSEELLKVFMLAQAWFPNNIKLFNRFGSFLIKMGDVSNGFQFILRAYKMAEEKGEPRLAIENNMLHIIWSKIPRWHFRMLNGRLRNKSFKRAIHKALDRGFKHVIDIGSGCGLLSLYAGIHPSRPNIIGFEENPILHNKAVALMAKYCEAIEYNCYNKLSYTVPQIVEPRRDLLITEIFDVGFFGEGILKTMKHAFEVLMNEGFTVIPYKVTLSVTGIECESLDKKFRLYNNIPELYDGVCVKKIVGENRYDAELFTLEKYEILTETVEFMDMELNDRVAVTCLLDEEWMNYFNMNVTKSGCINCFVIWFDLHLDDEIVISTNPFDPNYEPCWEQAIFYCKHPLIVEENDVIGMGISVIEGRLNFQLDHPPRCIRDYCFEISESAIRFLNDKKWTDYIIELTAEISNSENQLCIADFCEFPLAGLIAAKNGHKVFCFYNEPMNIPFISYIVGKANIDRSLVNLIEYENYPHTILNIERLDFAVFEPIRQDGSLNPCPLDNIVFQKLSWHSFIHNVIVHFAFIDSPYLDYCNRVSKENVEPFDGIVEEMNEYSGSEHPFLENNFPHEIMSNEVTWRLNEQPFLVESLFGLKNGNINGILTWFTLVGTTGTKFCTKESSNFGKNAFTFPGIKIKQNEKVQILCQYKSGGLFQIEICQQMWLQSNFNRITTNSFFKNFVAKNFRL